MALPLVRGGGGAHLEGGGEEEGGPDVIGAVQVAGDDGRLGAAAVDEQLLDQYTERRQVADRTARPDTLHPTGTPRRDAHARAAQRPPPSLTGSDHTATTIEEHPLPADNGFQPAAIKAREPVHEYIGALPWKAALGFGLGCGAVAVALGLLFSKRSALLPSILRSRAGLHYFRPHPKPILPQEAGSPTVRLRGGEGEACEGRGASGAIGALKVGAGGLILWGIKWLGTEVLHQLGWSETVDRPAGDAAARADGEVIAPFEQPDRAQLPQRYVRYFGHPIPRQPGQAGPQRYPAIPSRGTWIPNPAIPLGILRERYPTAPWPYVYETIHREPFSDFSRPSTRIRHGLQGDISAVPRVSAGGSWTMRLLRGVPPDDGPRLERWEMVWVELTRELDLSNVVPFTLHQAPYGHAPVHTQPIQRGLRLESWIVQVPCLVVHAQHWPRPQTYVKLHDTIHKARQRTDPRQMPGAYIIDRPLTANELVTIERHKPSLTALERPRGPQDPPVQYPVLPLATHADLPHRRVDVHADAGAGTDADVVHVPLDRYTPAEWANSIVILKAGEPPVADLHPHEIMHGGWVIDFLQPLPAAAGVVPRQRIRSVVRLTEYDAGLEAARNNRPKRTIYEFPATLRYDEYAQLDAVDIGIYTFTWGETPRGKTLFPGVLNVHAA